MLLGRIAVRLGRTQEGIALLEATAGEMRRVGVGYYADLADALIAEGEAVGGVAEQALAICGRLLTSGNSNVAMLRRVSAIAFARMGERDAARRELGLSLAAARVRGEDYEIALALDVLAALAALDHEQRVERDSIVARLGVVRLPAIPGLGHNEPAGEPVSELATA
jgi:hypothetical protein